MIASDVLHILQPVVHYSLHLLFPGLIAWVFFRDQWIKAWAIMLATMLVDLDHLAADPIFDPSRCSIEFHILHSYAAIAVYGAMSLVPRLRIIAAGLLIHMGTDYLDCLWMACS